MIAVGHSSIGVITALALNAVLPASTPFLVRIVMVFVVAFASHYLSDFIPHGHYYIDFKKLQIDHLVIFIMDLFGGALLFLALALGRFGFGTQFLLILSGIAGSQLTDVFEGLVGLGLIPKTKLVQAHSRFHMLMHWHNEPNSPLPGHGRPIRWTDMWQLVAFAVAITSIL